MPVGVTFNDCAPVYVQPRDQLAIVRLLPDRKAGTCCAPRIHHFVVTTLAVRHPFKEIEHQGFDRVEHGLHRPQIIKLVIYYHP